jgi:hypothetical protein
LLFLRPYGNLPLAVFNRWAMSGLASSVLSCLERERLEEELFEARIRGRNLSRLRHLTHLDRKALEEREQAAQARLRNHEAEHGCDR